ncbi:MAG: transporter permease [Bacillales bacterium]|jgi:ABC-2 type transport system permease protein|nr:transporter permease [Bacillales bacterium]
MKSYLLLTKAQLKIFARNRQVLFWTFFFPVFIMLMFGAFVGKDQGIKLSTAIVDKDNTKLTKSTIKNIKESSLFNIKENLDKDTAYERLENGNVDLIIEIPKGFTQKLNDQVRSPLEITVYYNEKNYSNAQVGITLVNNIFDNISKDAQNYNPLFKITPKGIEAIKIEYIDFLVPGIVAMMIMNMNMNGVAGQIASWRERGILRRMQGTTLKASNFISAQITARLFLNGTQTFFVILLAWLVFDIQIRGSLVGLVLFTVLGILTFMSLGFIIAGIAKTPESAGPIAGFLSFPMLFLGGVFFPISNMPELLQPIVKTLPIAQLTTSLREIMTLGTSISELSFELFSLIGWMVVSFVIASFTFKWE